MPNLTDIGSPAGKRLSQYIDTKYGNGDATLSKAMENDQHGYVAQHSIDELKRLLGTRAGDGRDIR